MRSRYDDLIEQANEKEETGDIDANDAYEIRSALFDIDTAYLRAVETHRLVKRSLGSFLELQPGQEYALDEAGTPEIELTIADLPRLQALAARMHPDMRALGSAVAALDESIEIEKSNRWPLILVGGGFSWRARRTATLRTTRSSSTSSTTPASRRRSTSAGI